MNKKRQALCALLIALPCWAAAQAPVGTPADQTDVPVPLPGPPLPTVPVQPKLEPTPGIEPGLTPWGTGEAKSYLWPVVEIPTFIFLLNQFDREFIAKEGETTYDTSWETIEEQLSRSWVADDDEFTVNQFGHPYGGSMYHTIARSTGHDFWPSFVFANAGSYLWEIAGETTPPSYNDQITTSIGGSYLGEALFRMASLLLERRKPGATREWLAAAISPATGFNRWAHGDRFDGIFPSKDPATFTRVHVGVNQNVDVQEGKREESIDRNEGALDFQLSYGLPGKSGYVYDRPFDYFNFQFTAASSNAFESILIRGLLWGTDYTQGRGKDDTYRGIWGLYGNYDFISPQLFRISNSALGVGTTFQWRPLGDLVFQSTATVGAGYAAAGTIGADDEKDYRFGLTPQALLALRTIIGDRFTIDLTGREFYVTDVGSSIDGGYDNILRADVMFTLRVVGDHALSLKYVFTDRQADYPGRPRQEQSVQAVSLMYTLLGDKREGVVDWSDVRTDVD